MNGLTTIASLPTGAGQASHQKPEIGKAREQFTPRVFPGLLDAGRLGQLGYYVNDEGLIERLEFPTIEKPPLGPRPVFTPTATLYLREHISKEHRARIEDALRIEDHSFPFEPWDYTERN